MSRPDPPAHEREAAARAVRAIRAANAATPAPAGLRARVTAARGAGTRPRHRGRVRPGLAAGLAGAVAAAALAAILLLPSGTPGGPSVSAAAALAGRPAIEPAPGVRAGDPALLDREAAEIPFPNFAPPFGWRATGARTDRVGGRRAVTVFYARGDRRVAYTIVAGRPLERPGGARSTSRAGTEFRSLRIGGRPVVTWRRQGHTCVLVGGPGVRDARLLALAGWRDGGSLPY